MNGDHKEGEEEEEEDKKCSALGSSDGRERNDWSQKKANSAKVPRHNLPLAPSSSNAPAKWPSGDAEGANLRRGSRANSAPNLCGMKEAEYGGETMVNRQRSTSVQSDSQKTLLKAVESMEQQEWYAKSLIENEAFFAVPARKRSTSGHSDGSRGIQGFWQQVDATQSIKLFGSDVVDMDDVDGGSNRVLPPPPPKRAEPSPKEHLIERERQARAETERARLRRQIALSREQERQHRQQSSNSSSPPPPSSSSASSSSSEPATTVIFSKAGLKTPPISVKNKFPESVACTAGEGTDYYDDEDDDESGDNNNFPEPLRSSDANDINQDDAPTEPLGFAMERFLTEGAVVVNGPAAGSQHRDVPVVVSPPAVSTFTDAEKQNNPPETAPAIAAATTPASLQDEDVASRTMAAIEVIRSSPALAPAGVVLLNTSDPTSGTLTGGVIMPCGSSATSSLLSDFLEPHDDLSHVMATSAAAAANADIARDPNAPTLDDPASAAAELDISAPVDVSLHSTNTPQAALLSSDAGLDGQLDDLAASLPSRSTMSAAGTDEDIADLVAQLETSSSVTSQSLDHLESTNSLVAIDSHDDHHHHNDDANRRHHDTQPAHSNITTSNSVVASAGNPDTSSIHSPTSHQASSHTQEDHHPGRLSEAELLTMAEIDYASIGNIPPLSLRDEGLASFSESSTGGGGGAGTGGSRYMARGGGSSAGAFAGVFTAFSEVTNTTVQESMSTTTSTGVNSCSHSVTGGQITHHSLTDADHHRNNRLHRQDEIHEDVLVVSGSSAGGASVASARSFQSPPSMSSSLPMQTHPHQPLHQGDHHRITSPIDFHCTDTQRTAFLPSTRPAAQHIHSYPHDTPTTPSSHDRSIQSTSTNSSNNNVNRIVRPGMMESAVGGTTGEPSTSPPSEPTNTSIIVDGFDYDKYNPTQIHRKDSDASNSQKQALGDHHYLSSLARGNLGAAAAVQNLPSTSSPHQSNSIDAIMNNHSTSTVVENDAKVAATGILYGNDRGNGSNAMEFYSHRLTRDKEETANRNFVQQEEDTSNEKYHDYGAVDLDDREIGEIYSHSENLFAEQQGGDLPIHHNYPHHGDNHEEGQHSVHETSPLMNSVPRHFNMDVEENGLDRQLSPLGEAKEATFRSVVSSVFSSVRSVSTDDIEADMNDSDKYLASGVLARAFPERFFALVVTLIVEIPVLFMISGGSDRLCSLIGRKRYQLMMAFLPLSSAISGNCGLQGSTLTTRAVSHEHVTKKSFMRWLRMEMGASLCLGLSMGALLGIVAYQASGHDLAFGLTIYFAQFVSILTAGLTGTLAPLIFTFIFHSDSGKWGGPLETAIQDIIGSFAMVILSYQLLVLMGSSEIDPDDICGAP